MPDVLPDAPTVHPWLRQFQAVVQPMIISWFHYAAAQRPQTPEAVLQIVERVVHNKLDWATTTPTREACTRVLLALRHQRGQDLDYARALLARTDAP